RLIFIESQVAFRMLGTARPWRLASVTLPSGVRNAPSTIWMVGRIKNSRANSRNGATPSQLRGSDAPKRRRGTSRTVAAMVFAPAIDQGPRPATGRGARRRLLYVGADDLVPAFG